MNATTRKLTSFSTSLVTSLMCAFVALYGTATHAAPGTLSPTPLFLSSAVQPNIALMVDDSGSMKTEGLLNKGTYDPGHWGPFNNWSTLGLDYTPNDREERRMLCVGFNLMAYNPAVQYTPWIGEDSAGNPYADLTLTTARYNPYNTSTTNISSYRYFPWTDTDGDGEYDGPGSTSANAAASATDECGDVSDNTPSVAVNTLPATGTASNPNSQQNYANWWSYYRKRDYVAKRALSQIITESSTRMGLASINSSVSPLAVRDVDDISLPLDTTAQANKNTLMSRLFSISPAGSTPLRRALRDAGDYYADVNSTWGATPILSQTNGGECQKNFTLLLSDGFWNQSTPSPAPGNNDINSNNGFDGGSFEDNVSNTLADIAMHYYETDLSSLADLVPVTTGVDPTGLTNNLMHQHMKTFTVAFGIDGTLSANPPDQTSAFAWPTPVSDTLTTVDDMRHAAWNGRGDFLSARDPQQLITSLNASFSSIAAQAASGAAVALNTSTLSTNSQVYLARFTSGIWTGNLVSYALNAVTGAINNTATWAAGDELTTRDISSNPRKILTSNGSDGVAFQWTNLSNAQKNDLRINSSGGTDDDSTALARLEYLRGERSCEIGNTGTCSHTQGANPTYTAKGLRTRNSRLGDIVHSAPVYVGVPEVNWPDSLPGTTPYSAFRQANSNRTGVVYLGANDGMLHGFAESDGSELLAYVPNSLFSSTVNEGLHYLTDPSYSHRYYVDLRPTVSDVFAKTTPSGTAAWNTVLVGGMRGGGRGIFALDITDPTAYSEAGTAPADTVMWEFSSAVDADLGYTFSRPSIVLLNNGKWAVIFGNGYNDAGSGEAKLFILFLEDGLDGTWSATDYMKITTGVGSAGSRNGLSTPAVIDSDGDGTADRIYAGDLVGNMWAFDLSSATDSNWDVAYKDGSNVPVPLFSAGSSKPITAAPVIVRNPDVVTAVSNAPNALVIFGTGQYIALNDNTSTASQSFYAVWDDGSITNTALTASDLQAQTIGTGSTTGGATGRTATNYPVSYIPTPPSTTVEYGWRMDLPTSGERVVTDAVVRGKHVLFNTAIPDSNPCGSGGSGWQMAVKINNGGRPDNVAFDLNGNGLLDVLDEINSEAAAGAQIQGLPSSPVTLGKKRYTSTTQSIDGASIAVDDIEEIKGVDTGRLSWEELVR